MKFLLNIASVNVTKFAVLILSSGVAAIQQKLNCST